MSNVMVLPGTDYQVALIRRLQELGHVVVCVHPDTSAPGFRLADIGVEGDILDKELCLRAAQEHDIAAILSDQCDIAMPTVAYVGEALGLRTLSREQARLYTDKSMMREFSQRHGFPCPAYKVCRTKEEAAAFVASVGAKCIIKPLDCNSSRGVFSVNCAADAEGYFDASVAYSKLEKAVIVEEYIDGPEFSIEGMFLRGRHYSLAVCKKEHYPFNENLDRRLIFSYDDPEYDYTALREQNDEYVAATGLKIGFTHAEYKFSRGRYWLIEIGARGGGSYLSSHIQPALTGVDNYRVLIAEALGEELPSDLEISYRHKNRCAVLQFLDCEREGIVREIENAGLLADSPLVMRYGIHAAPGQKVMPIADGGTRPGYFVACAESRTELENFIEEADKKIKIVSEAGI